MGTKVYLDTNIILDLCDSKRSCAKVSQVFIDKLFEESVEFYINSDTLSTTFFILKARAKTTQEIALKVLKHSATFCEVVPVEKKDALQAIALCSDTSTGYLDYEDAIQYICAKKIGADMIITNDKGFVSEEIPLKTTC